MQVTDLAAQDPAVLADYDAGRGKRAQVDARDARHRGDAFRAAIGFESTRRYVDSVLSRRSRKAG